MSTMCSMTFGPAIWPSLVTWPIRMRAEPLALGVADQGRGAASELGDGAGRRFHALRPERLHGVDDDEGRGRRAAQSGDDVGEVGLDCRERPARRSAQDAPPACVSAPAPPRRRDTRRARRIRRASRRCLEQQGRFADAGVAADKHGGARHEPAAENPVELGDAGGIGAGLRRSRLQGSQARQAALCPP